MSKQNRKTVGLIATIASIVLVLCLCMLLPTFAENSDLENTYYTVTVSSNIGTINQTSVSVSGDFQNEDGQFRYGSTVKLTAVAGNGYRFVKWVGDTTSLDATFSFQVTKTNDPLYLYSYQAIFEPIKYDISIVPDERTQYATGKEPPSPFQHTYGTETVLPEPLNTPGYTFDGWWVESNGEKRFIAKDENGMKLGAQEYSGAILLTAQYSPISFDITCEDKTETNIHLGTSSFQAPFDEKDVPATRAPERIYRGYYFLESVCNYTSVPSVSANSAINTVERIYKAKTYKIIYQNCEIPAGTAQLYTYGTVATVLIPTRPGYTFLGWTMENWYEEDGTVTQKQFDYNGNSLFIRETDYDNPSWDYNTNKNDESVYAIRLTARWAAVDYDVLYQDVEGVSKLQLDALPKTHNMDEPFVLDAVLDRKGYVFLGWKIEGMNDYEATLTLNAASRPIGSLKVYAGWKAVSYDVALDPNGGTGGDTTLKVTYDQDFPSQFTPPTLAGHTFIGYDYEAEDGSVTRYYYFDESTQSFKSRAWDIAVPSGETVTLVARWQRNNYDVTVDSDLLDLADVKLTVNGTDYVYVKGTTETFCFEYRSVITVTVSVKGNGKLVQWNGQAIAHTATYTVTLDELAEDITLNGVVLEKLQTPTLSVDYAKEIFTKSGSASLPAGSYKLLCGNAEPIFFTVSTDGVITFTADGSTASSLKIEPYLGKEVGIVLCGDGAATADSDAQSIQVAGRPSAPERNAEIDFITPLDYSIRISMKDGSVYTFEFACSPTRSPDGITGLTYGSTVLFENLRAGTPYYIYIRVAASESYPHGEAFEAEIVTLSAQYLQTQIDRLMDLKQSGDGENVNGLLSAAEKEMKELKPSADYVEKMQEIYDRAAEEILLARVKDRAIAELSELCKNLCESGSYNQEVGIAALEAHLSDAKTAINAAKTESEVQRLVSEATSNFDSVKISYLFQGDVLRLYNALGMHRNYKIAASRINDLATVSQQIRNAISAGTIVVGGTQMTLAEAAEALKTLDVLAYYNLQLTNSETGVAKPVGPYEIRLLIPEDLRGEQGLLVAYYQSTNEELTVLDTRREGNYLIFTADSVANFVILGDHTVNLTGLLIALSVTLLVQIVAIALMLVSRIKHAKRMRSYSFSLLTLALTVRFLPNNATTVAIVLTVLVIVMQIVLLWLLLTSELVARRRRSRDAQPPVENPPVEQETRPEADEDQVTEVDAVALSVLTSEELEKEAFEMTDDYEESLAVEEAELSDAATFEPDPEEAEPTEEDWYGDQSFIEPAAVSRYSLPDDEWGQTSEEAQAEYTEEYAEEQEAYTEEYADEYTEEQEAYTEEYADEYTEEQEAYTEEYADEYTEEQEAYTEEQEAYTEEYADEYTEEQEAYTEEYADEYTEEQEAYTEEYADEYTEEENAEFVPFDEYEETSEESAEDAEEVPEKF